MDNPLFVEKDRISSRRPLNPLSRLLEGVITFHPRKRATKKKKKPEVEGAKLHTTVDGMEVVIEPGLHVTQLATCSLVVGTYLLMWIHPAWSVAKCSIRIYKAWMSYQGSLDERPQMPDIRRSWGNGLQLCLKLKACHEPG